MNECGPWIGGIKDVYLIPSDEILSYSFSEMLECLRSQLPIRPAAGEVKIFYGIGVYIKYYRYFKNRRFIKRLKKYYEKENS